MTSTTTLRPHHKHWPRRLPHAITPPATSLWDNLAVSARRYPDKPALIFFGRQTSYRELCEGTERLAAYLHSIGVRKGDRVILLMQNCPQLVLAHFAILRANAVVVPVNPMNLADELQHYIQDSEARTAIVSAELASELAKASNGLAPAQRLQHMLVTHYTDAFDAGVSGPDAPPAAWASWLTAQHPMPALEGGSVHGWAQALACSAAPPALEIGPDDLSMLPYTSGTTGLPKGCMHTHRSVMHNVEATGLWVTMTPETVSLGVVPMFHITGMVALLHASIFSSVTVVLLPRWDRDLAGHLISHYGVTHWLNIPTMVIDLMASPHLDRYDLSSLVFIGGGGAAMPQAVAQRLFEKFQLHFAEGYGLTETAAPSHFNPPDEAKLQCMGIPWLSTDSRIMDPQTLQEVPIGEQGEIIIHGPQLFSGYWKQPEASAQAFVELDGKRFFRTGDLGRMDEDGYFFITDRLKRMINASGFKVWPSEVEMLMFRHPAIAEACVIAARDSYRGETVKAVVVLRQEYRGKVSAEDIIAWCREHMAAYKVPRIVEFIDALPKSGSGKVMWRLLQEQEQQASQK